MCHHRAAAALIGYEAGGGQFSDGFTHRGARDVKLFGQCPLVETRARFAKAADYLRLDCSGDIIGFAVCVVFHGIASSVSVAASEPVIIAGLGADHD